MGKNYLGPYNIDQCPNNGWKKKSKEDYPGPQLQNIACYGINNME